MSTTIASTDRDHDVASWVEQTQIAEAEAPLSDEAATSADEDSTAANEELELCVVFYNGHVNFIRGDDTLVFEDMRTFAYDKVAPYAALISKAFEELGEGNTRAILLHRTSTMDKVDWRVACWWELELKLGHRPLLDEPFRELLGMLEKAHDALEGAKDAPATGFGLPQIKGVTVDVPIFKLARLLWAARHLELKSHLGWTTELRKMLLKAINAIEPHDPKPAFRAIDFWYIWGAFRNFDDDVVHKMVVKFAEAMDLDSHPDELKRLMSGEEGIELQVRVAKLRKGQSNMTWAERMAGKNTLAGRRNTAVKPLGRGNTSTWHVSSGPATYDAEVTKQWPKTAATTTGMAPVTILQKPRADSFPSKEPDHDVNGNQKGAVFAPPSDVGPPQSAKGSGGHKKKATWKGNGSKRGKAKDEGDDWHSGW